MSELFSEPCSCRIMHLQVASTIGQVWTIACDDFLAITLICTGLCFLPCHVFTLCESNLEALLVACKAAALQSFHSRTGRAYLFSAVVNLVSAEKETRLMTTGLHTVCDLYCNGCMQAVGWSYVSTVLATWRAACLFLCPISGYM